MKTAGLIALLSIATATVAAAATAFTAERPLSPPPAARPFVSSTAASSPGQVPLLFIVDGVRYASDQVPLLSEEQVAAVEVIKGHRALEQYGPDASYGVVIIRTKQASSPRS
jgi:hypothetical protein